MIKQGFLLLLITIVLSQRTPLEFKTQRLIPPGWIQKEAPNPETTLRLTFALKIQDAERLESLFWSVSDPASSNYVQYLTYEEICEQFSANDQDIATLRLWLTKFGISKLTIPKTKDFVEVDVSVKDAEDMFQVKFHKFEHPNHPTITRTLDVYTLPTEIAKFVHFVTGMNKFPSQRMIARHQNQKRALSQNGVTPQVIYQTFKTGGIKGQSTNNLQSVAQFLQQYYDPADLADFQKHFNLPNQPVDKVLGPNDATNPGTEALLDIEYIIATAPNVTTWFWSTGGEHEGQEPFVLWATNMNNANPVPWVVSVSYGDEESSITKDYADALNVQFQKLALRGVSVLFASGDNGVGCTSACVMDPNWPASSPFITSVGGFTKSMTGDFISSGGFSNYYPQPAYQSQAVLNYLQKGPNMPPLKSFNKTSRAMPDVSSFSEDVLVVQGGFVEPVGGTSCASPVFAGIVTLINDAVLLKGGKPLGFLNTALYQIGASKPSAFLDITTGSNPSGCCQGFHATTGWDPITGWGGPSFPDLLSSFAGFQNIAVE